jgi:phosphoribosylformylglycinamidine synthase
MKTPKVILLRTAGTNCEYETKSAFEKAGASGDIVHINKWITDKELIRQYQILAFPGGFSYGDDLGSGTVLGNEIKQNVLPELVKFVNEGKLVIGICNGFQILTKLGLLPGLNLKSAIAKNPDKNCRDLRASNSLKLGLALRQDATLTTNNSGRYDDRWVYLKKSSQTCVFTKEWDRSTINLPVAHAEGKFIPASKAILSELKKNDQIVFRYSTEDGTPTAKYPLNPNGAVDNIAGICDPTGRILGMMPHPERFQDATNHPNWTRRKIKEPTDGMLIFLNAVKYSIREL